MSDEKSFEFITDSVTLKNKTESSLLIKLEGKSEKMDRLSSLIKETALLLFVKADQLPKNCTGRLCLCPFILYFS